MATDLSMLNEQQRVAVEESLNENVVLLAGAGSGKTTTVVKRVQYLVDDYHVDPSSIMMITFTNKAANEILDRVRAVSPDAHKMWIGTFHRICTRLIRKFGHYLGIKSFTIIDGNDQKELIKDIASGLGLEWTAYNVKNCLTKISTYKNEMLRPNVVAERYPENTTLAKVYKTYQDVCWQRKCFDFDDLIIYAILLLSSYPDVLNWVNTNIKYVCVDEAQDSNTAQFQLIKLLAGKNNLMMVGDVSQSIYKFRNAKPQYLSEFQKLYPNSKKMYLQRNYRSTQTIISAANALIANNKFGERVEMVCPNEKGDPIEYIQLYDNYNEARWIAAEILNEVRCGRAKYEDFAIIYRANFQSRALEDEFINSGLPYVIFGSTSFYSRKEVKDLLAFCKVVINPNDINAFNRILKTLPGVGKKTIEAIVEHQTSQGLTCIQGLASYVTNGTKVKKALISLSAVLSHSYQKCSDIVNSVMQNTEYATDLFHDYSEEAKEKLDIIKEFHNMLTTIEDRDPSTPMDDIIDQVSLLSDAKGADKSEVNSIKMMTGHSSKGLEFTNVFVVGCEEGLFPHANSINSRLQEDIEEERRLFYVAITRAKKKLYLTRALSRKADGGGFISTAKSRFIKEIPSKLIQEGF